MKIVKVIPISKGISKETLSYFVSGKIEPGYLVDINLRGRIRKGLVVGSKEAKDEKTELKSAGFSLKKLEGKKGRLLVLPSFFRSVERAAVYFAASLGSLLHDLLPKSLLELEGRDLDNISRRPQDGSSKKVLSSVGRVYHEKLVLQDEQKERISWYKGLIREELASERSVYIISPTILSSENLFTELSQGIEKFSHIINGSLPSKKQKEIITDIISSVGAAAVFMTPQFLALPREDIGLFIFDKESSDYYKKENRPFIDWRIFGEILAEETKRRVIFGDTYLRTETLWREKDKDFEAILPPKTRLVEGAEIELIDMKNDGKKFEVIDKEVVSLIEEYLSKSKKIFIFSVRQGLYPLSVCNDCGQTVKCEKCDSPAVLHESPTGNFFLCHKCGRAREAENRCRFCGSWRLSLLGIGVELVEKEARRHFREAKIFRLDGRTGKTRKSADKILNEFKKAPSGILVGTRIALHYLKKADLSVVISADSFFAIPDFRASERLFSMLLEIRAKTSQKMIVQTRNIEEKTLEYFKNGALLDFYRLEISERERFKFPPFTKLIKFTYGGDKEKVKAVSAELEKLFQDYEFFTYPSFVGKMRGKIIYNGLLRLGLDAWPNDDIREKILTLSPAISVDVKPESVL